jgi:hypothetical protein
MCRGCGRCWPGCRSKAADERLVLAVDVTHWLRPDAPTSPDRLFRHVYGRSGRSSDQFVPGWPYSFVATLESARTSWCQVLDALRLGPADDVAEVTATQVRRVVEDLIDMGRWQQGDRDIPHVGRGLPLFRNPVPSTIRTRPGRQAARRRTAGVLGRLPAVLLPTGASRLRMQSRIRHRSSARENRPATRATCLKNTTEAVLPGIKLPALLFAASPWTGFHDANRVSARRTIWRACSFPGPKLLGRRAATSARPRHRPGDQCSIALAPVARLPELCARRR